MCVCVCMYVYMCVCVCVCGSISGIFSPFSSPISLVYLSLGYKGSRLLRSCLLEDFLYSASLFESSLAVFFLRTGISSLSESEICLRVLNPRTPVFR